MNLVILCRDRGPRTERLEAVLSAHGEIRVVADRGPVPADFRGLCSPALKGEDSTTAWDRAFHGIDAATTWFVEDDVAGSASAFDRLFESTREVDADLVSLFISPRPKEEPADPWYWWHLDPGIGKPYRSFNPLCRLSAALIDRLQDYRRRHGRFCSRRWRNPGFPSTRWCRGCFPGSGIGRFTTGCRMAWRPGSSTRSRMRPCIDESVKLSPVRRFHPVYPATTTKRPP